MVIVFDNLTGDKSIPEYNGENFHTSFKYPRNSQRVIDQEFKHYQNLFKNRLSDIIAYLKNNSFSKRAIMDVWSDTQRDLNNRAECLVYLLFRKTSNGLDMHVHMRANDAINKSLVNFHIFAAIHKFVAESLNCEVGTYYYFVDSYHIYR